MSLSGMAKRVCVTTMTVAGIITRTAALAANSTPQCDVTEFYDVTAGSCQHCDAACFEYNNGTIVGYTESRCLQMCPGYIKAPRVSQPPKEPEEVPLTLMDGCLVGFLVALVVVCLLVLLLLRKEVYLFLKDCARPAKRVSSVRDVMCGLSQADIREEETSYVKLADPSDEVEIIDRVTCV